jgi:hypothetical protein
MRISRKTKLSQLLQKQTHLSCIFPWSTNNPIFDIFMTFSLLNLSMACPLFKYRIQLGDSFCSKMAKILLSREWIWGVTFFINDDDGLCVYNSDKTIFYFQLKQTWSNKQLCQHLNQKKEKHFVTFIFQNFNQGYRWYHITDSGKGKESNNKTVRIK